MVDHHMQSSGSHFQIACFPKHARYLAHRSAEKNVHINEGKEGREA